jgi:hypothetical protein
MVRAENKRGRSSQVKKHCDLKYFICIYERRMKLIKIVEKGETG